VPVRVCDVVVVGVTDCVLVGDGVMDDVAVRVGDPEPVGLFEVVLESVCVGV
jgi:hypothetical protein